MTVIAYRDGVMAGDSLWTDDDLVLARQSKICRLKSGALYGGAGGLNDRALVEVLQTVESWDSLPDIGDMSAADELSALVVFPDGSIAMARVTGEGGTIIGVRGMPFVAIGSGRALALGAMGFGASAVEAAGVACRFDPNCGGPVVWLNLSNPVGDTTRKHQ
jgi:ATP-dependent protease HslVU (ClpYQ) peptidase subunit